MSKQYVNITVLRDGDMAPVFCKVLRAIPSKPETVDKVEFL